MGIKDSNAVSFACWRLSPAKTNNEVKSMKKTLIATALVLASVNAKASIEITDMRFINQSAGFFESISATGTLVVSKMACWESLKYRCHP